MFTRPDELTDDVLASALAAGWGIEPGPLEYRPVGFGSHHWAAGPWFVTVDDLDQKRRTAYDTADAAYARLDAAFRACRSLAVDAGLDFAVAPEPTADGGVLWRMADRWSVVVHPHLDGRECGAGGEYTSDDDRRTVLGRLVAMHRATGRLTSSPRADDFLVPHRDTLFVPIGDTGPYATPARDLIARHADGVRRLFAYYDELVDRVAARPGRMVVTHGEPHAGNVLATAGGLRLLDWDTTLLAPPERDLWDLAASAPWILDEYPGEIDRDALDLYRLWYDLCEVGGYLALFRAPHADTADAAESWTNLEFFLRPAQRWPARFSSG
jgi:spectinomycin phosphotransferase/16S rRNA (guanine(1405)-N(7))-methyltransferase